MISLSPGKYRTGLVVFVSLTVAILIWTLYRAHAPFTTGLLPMYSSKATTARLAASLEEFSQFYIDNPPLTSQFGELGSRVRLMTEWVQDIDSLGSKTEEALSLRVEDTIISTFPFVRDPSKPDDARPLASLRDTFVPGSKGIVIVSGKGTFRYACHLISNIRMVLQSSLPIQVAYAGDEDLPVDYREALISLGQSISMLDVTTVLDTQTLGFDTLNGGWAVKAFALLGSSFEQVVLVDADAVFLQPPDVIFNDHKRYKETGTLLFHDRLLWQGAFKERHQWWEKQMEGHIPSATLNKSLVYNEGYAEEGDSGVVALDKSRVPVLLGLLHVCWQNTLSVRKAVTYTMGYGDKESWWFGFELSGVPYAFEQHYGSMMGDLEPKTPGRVCSFTIAHVDGKDKLLWYNGSLLKNKAVNRLEYSVPSHWMMEGTWEKGATKPEISCMRDGVIRNMDEGMKKIVEASVEAAKKIDEDFKGLIEV